jgi:hypothetical protein
MDQIRQIKSEEINYKLEKIVRINSENSYLNGHYAKIKKIPIYLLAQISSGDSDMADNNKTLVEYECNDICLNSHLLII